MNVVPDFILHSDFLSLINERNSTEQDVYGTEHFGTDRRLGILRKKTGYTAGFIMIFDDICFQSIFLDIDLRTQNCITPCFEIYMRCIVPAMSTIAEGMRTEIKDCGEMSVISNKLTKFISFHIEYFTNGESIIFLKSVFLQIFKEFSYTVNVFDHFPAGGHAIRSVRFIVRKSKVFFDVDDRIDTETGKAFFKPPVDHIVKLLTKLWVLPVQIRLFFGEHMEIVFVCSRNRFPAAAAEVRTIVAWRVTVFSFPEIKIICIFTIWISQSFLEPFMFVRAVVDDQIHDDMHITFFCFCKQFIKLFHSSEFFCNCIVI